VGHDPLPVPGVEWGAAIVEAIENSRAVVLIFSSHADQSPQVRREIERAVNQGVPIIPFRIENLQPTRSLAYFMSSVHWLDAISPPIENHLLRLADILNALLKVHAPPPSTADRETAKSQSAIPIGGASTTLTAPEPPSVRTIASPRNIALALAGLVIAAAVAAYFLWWRASAPIAVAGTNEASLKSLPSTAKAEVSFRNERGAPIHVYWITFDGTRRKYTDLAPGASGRLATFLGHPWVVTDADDRCLGIYMPQADARDYVIR
jgi:VHL beta domain/TIR domain